MCQINEISFIKIVAINSHTLRISDEYPCQLCAKCGERAHSKFSEEGASRRTELLGNQTSARSLSFFYQLSK